MTAAAHHDESHARAVDRLCELASIGSGHAAGALATLLGRPFEMRVPEARVLAAGAAGAPFATQRTMRVTPVPAQGNKVRLSVQITEGAKNLLTTTLGLSRGGMVLGGGPSHQAGVLILIISAE